MRVAKDRVVAIDYTIRDVSGEIVDTTSGRKPFVYLHGYEQIVPGVEAALNGLPAGAALDVSVGPREAYGERDPRAVLILPRRAFPAGQEPEVGDLYRANKADGRPVVFTVLDVSSESVVVDANHPLAGQTLHVHVEVVSVRSATADECRHEHVHAGAVVSTSQLA
jgi:FKBP-type peptidyl-prolyl cis-trans isomerase SlyD